MLDLGLNPDIDGHDFSSEAEYLTLPDRFTTLAVRLRMAT